MHRRGVTSVPPACCCPPAAADAEAGMKPTLYVPKPTCSIRVSELDLRLLCYIRLGIIMLY
jgi:hypothetical protein